jgi:hypothetical protein
MNEKPNPKRIGEISEAVITVELMKLGYVVSKPVGDNQRYDLIIDSEKGLLKCQCKTGRIRNRHLVFNTASTRINKNGYFIRGYKDSCDLFLVYCPDNDSVYKIPVEVTTKSSFSILFEKSNKSNRKEVASDYLLK